MLVEADVDDALAKPINNIIDPDVFLPFYSHASEVTTMDEI